MSITLSLYLSFSVSALHWVSWGWCRNTDPIWSTVVAGLTVRSNCCCCWDFPHFSLLPPTLSLLLSSSSLTLHLLWISLPPLFWDLSPVWTHSRIPFYAFTIHLISLRDTESISLISVKCSSSLFYFKWSAKVHLCTFFIFYISHKLYFYFGDMAWRLDGDSSTSSL